jgi:hypothetical protein
MSTSIPEVSNEPRRLGIAELRVRAESILLDVVRQTPRLHFTRDAISDYVDAKLVRKALGMDKEDNRELEPMLTTAAGKLNKKIRSFKITVQRSTYSQMQLTAHLAEDAEWNQAVEEAWSYSDSPNEFALTNPALGLLRFIRSGDLEQDFMSERSISWKMGLNGRERCIEPYLRELETKTKIGLHWEGKGTEWSERPKYRFWIAPTEPEPAEQPALNPRIERHLDRFIKADVDEARTIIHKWLLELKPAGTEVVYFLSIGSRAELQHCLPQPHSRSSTVLAEFFSAIILNPEIARGYNFRDEAERWTVTLQPKTDWEPALSAIGEELSKPTLQERFGLSDEAAKLLTWIENLPEEKKLLGRVTPIVEDSATKFIGIKCPWSEENTAVYLQLLIDEINERTNYELRLQPWYEYNRMRSRIVVKKKRHGVEEVIRQLQALACEQGRNLNAARTRHVIDNLIAVTTECDNG